MNVPTATLTERQQECVRLLAAGNTTRQSGSILHISDKTVEKHIQAAMDNLGIHDRVMLTNWALHTGLAKNIYANGAPTVQPSNPTSQ